MGPLPLRRQVALEEMEFNRCRSPSDPYVAQQSRTRYAHRYIYNKTYIHPYLQVIRLLRHLPNDIDLRLWLQSESRPQKRDPRK